MTVTLILLAIHISKFKQTKTKTLPLPITLFQRSTIRQNIFTPSLLKRGTETQNSRSRLSFLFLHLFYWRHRNQVLRICTLHLLGESLMSHESMLLASGQVWDHALIDSAQTQATCSILSSDREDPSQVGGFLSSSSGLLPDSMSFTCHLSNLSTTHLSETKADTHTHTQRLKNNLAYFKFKKMFSLYCF